MQLCRTATIAASTAGAGPVAPAERAGAGAAAGAAAALLEVVPAVMRTIRREMRRGTAAELTVVQFRSLALAASAGGEASVSAVAEHIGLTLPSASKLVDGLVKRGYVRRRNDPADRRTTLLEATAKGRRVVNAARAETRKVIAGMLTGLSAAQLAEVMGAAESLAGVFGKPGLARAEEKKDGARRGRNGVAARAGAG